MKTIYLMAHPNVVGTTFTASTGDLSPMPLTIKYRLVDTSRAINRALGRDKSGPYDG